MPSQVVYVVVMGSEPPKRVMIKTSLRESLHVAAEVADAGAHRTVTAFEVDLKNEEAKPVRLSLVEDGGISPLALDLGLKQVSRQLHLLGATEEPEADGAAGGMRVINPAMR